MAAGESYPDDLRYNKEHDWARIEGDEATLGITWFAQDSLGELVHFEPPAVGDTINTVARLTAVAGIGEILISAAAATAAGLDTSRLERRTLELRGREETVDAWVQPASSSVATTAA